MFFGTFHRSKKEKARFGSMSHVEPYKNQEYERLKNRHNSSNLFIDPAFPTEIRSLFPSGRSSLRSGRSVYDIEWRRPHVRLCYSYEYYYLFHFSNRSFATILCSLWMVSNVVTWTRVNLVISR